MIPVSTSSWSSPDAGVRHRAGRPRSAFTLVELLVSLAIIAMISVAVSTMTVGAINSDRYIRAANTAQAESELSMRRMANNLRSAQTGTISIGTSTFTCISQPDASNGYPSGATVVYSLQNDPQNSSQKVLIENDPRYGSTNILAHNVTTFTIVLVSGYTDYYQVDLVLGTTPPQERHFRVYNRN